MKSKKIAFIDSGVGGLIFACDTITQMNAKYDISNLSFFHIGDSANMPYGLKTEEQLKVLITNLINKAIEYGANIIVIACNTACTVIDNTFLQQFPKHVSIVTIIEKTSEFIYSNTKVVNGEKNIAILGTKQTISSKRYENCLISCHKSNTDFTQNISSYSPVEWEELIEGGVNDETIAQQVEKHMNILKDAIGNERFARLGAVGLCCTHYPFFKTHILNFFDRLHNKKDSIQIFCQGEIFADLLAEKCNLKPVGSQMVINVKSYITGSNMDKIRSTISSVYTKINFTFKKI